ncbi:hypothetical protein [unidentified bacterial endosymbiont]|uniref:hypothetical protein n=1 Tax=unidentified bacterial endosymbiont TaxID=2355 RepID=UPI00209FE8EC|nr:hypothetical protein [unidentified bacterial endosymbiont]
MIRHFQGKATGQSTVMMVVESDLPVILVYCWQLKSRLAGWRLADCQRGAGSTPCHAEKRANLLIQSERKG